MLNKKDNTVLNNALNIFKNTSKNVEAYKKFLKQKKVSSQEIIKKKDFESIPIMDKKNYLLAFKPLELVPFSKFPPMFSASSGSSGKPYYWPRGTKQEERGARIHRTILKDIFKIGNKKTLVIICFSMGNWVAGTYTLTSLREIANDKNTNLSIITPGIDKNDVIQTLKNFAGNFEKVIMFGYPPFLMDVVCEAKEINLNLKKFNIDFVFAGENFSEKWRELILKYAGISKKEKNRSISVYGTADAGAIGHENPFTILIRKLMIKNLEFKKELLGNVSFLPTIVSYDPMDTYFEVIDNELIFTTDSGIPLVRYNIKDYGILLSNVHVLSLIKKHGLSKYVTNDIKKWVNPLIVLRGRSDVSTTFYGLNIYPENIKTGLESDKIFHLITGKYTIKTEEVNDYREQKLKIEIELRPKVLTTEEINKIITDEIVKSFKELNTEYRKLFNSINEKAIPEIVLIEHGDERFIIKKAKHKWIQNK
jgi:phenylacetate-CoA ligase